MYSSSELFGYHLENSPYPFVLRHKWYL